MCLLLRCGFPAPVSNSKDQDDISRRLQTGDLMRKVLVAVFSVILALGLSGCWGKGKAPVGKGKAPVVQTRG